MIYCKNKQVVIYYWRTPVETVFGIELESNRRVYDDSITCININNGQYLRNIQKIPENILLKV